MGCDEMIDRNKAAQKQKQEKEANQASQIPNAKTNPREVSGKKQIPVFSGFPSANPSIPNCRERHSERLCMLYEYEDPMFINVQKGECFSFLLTSRW